MSKTTAEEIRQRLLEGYDPEYQAQCARQIAYAFGEKWEASATQSGSGGTYIDIADIEASHKEVGRSRRILNAQFTALSRNNYGEAEPEFPQVDKQTGEVRKQFFLERYRGGEWSTEIDMAFMDGDGVGFGGVLVGLKTNPATEKQRVHIKHIPATQIFWDRHERNPGNARWMAFVHYMAPEDAEAEFGADAIAKGIVTMWESIGSRSFKQVRVIEYWDVGCGGKEPTRAIIIGQLSDEPYKIEPNPYGCIPFAYYVHFVAPGMRRPVGKIPLQMATQEALNKIERRIDSVLSKPGVDIVDTSQISIESLKRYNRGEAGEALERIGSNPEAPAIERVQGQELQQTELARYNMLEQQFNADSGTTEADRGNLATSKRTATETDILDRRSQTSASWSEKQSVLFRIRLVEKVLKVASAYDRDPILLDIHGSNILFNDPQNPNSWIDAWCEEPSRIVISEDSLRKRDLRADRMEALEQLQALEGLVNIGLVDQVWYTEEFLKALGFDPKEAMTPMGEQAAGAPQVAPMQQPGMMPGEMNGQPPAA